MKKYKKINTPKREIKTRKPSADLRDTSSTVSKVTGLMSTKTSAKAPSVKKVKTEMKNPFKKAKGLKASTADYKMKKLMKMKKKKK